MNRKHENRPVVLAATSNARLSAHSGSELVTRKQLATYATPAPTATWMPIAHADVPKVIEQMVQEKGWKFARKGDDRFKLAVTPTGSKMFGVTDIVIPDTLADAEFGLALGFRNSHDKSFALRIAVGTNVFICDNLMVTGDIQVRREHTLRIDVRTVVESALELVPQAAIDTAKWFSAMRSITMSTDTSVAFLAQCVEAKALPVVDFMDARAIVLGKNDEDEDAASHPAHMGTLWAAYQSVTLMWKRHSLMQTQAYSSRLNEVIQPMLS